jgi:hypothetical protein
MSRFVSVGDVHDHLDSGRHDAQSCQSPRVTVLDRFLSEHIQPDGTVTLKRLLSRPGPEGRNCVARLQHLKKLELAVEERPGIWRPADGWKRSLAGLGQENDRIERLYPIVGERAADYQFVDPKLPLSTFEAVVIGKGLHDELSGQMFVAARAADDRGYYVPLRPEVAENLQRGDRIRVGITTEKWLRESAQAKLTPAEALSKTIDFAVRDLLSRDRCWQAYKRTGGRPVGTTETPPSAPAPAPAPSSLSPVSRTATAPSALPPPGGRDGRAVSQTGT